MIIPTSTAVRARARGIRAHYCVPIRENARAVLRRSIAREGASVVVSVVAVVVAPVRVVAVGWCDDDDRDDGVRGRRGDGACALDARRRRSSTRVARAGGGGGGRRRRGRRSRVGLDADANARDRWDASEGDARRRRETTTEEDDDDGVFERCARSGVDYDARVARVRIRATTPTVVRGWRIRESA